MRVIKDSEGHELEVGAMYCCVTEVPATKADESYPHYGDLVRYVGVNSGAHTFADADTWDETSTSWCARPHRLSIRAPKAGNA
jgi:hypothetical protein